MARVVSTLCRRYVPAEHLCRPQIPRGKIEFLPRSRPRHSLQTIFTARIPAVWTNNPFLPSLKLPDDWPETGIVTRGLLLPARPGDGSSRQLDFPIRKKDFPIRALIFLQIGRIPERRFRFLLYLFGLLLILLLKFRRRKEEF